MVKDPSHEVLFQLKPEIRKVKTTVELQPLLDGPSAFEIKIHKGSFDKAYLVSWNGELEIMPAA